MLASPSPTVQVSRASPAVPPNCLTEAGFDDVAAIDSAPVDVTTVYYIEGFEEVAALVAVELFIDPDALADMSSAPDLETDEEFDVVAVLGADVGP